MELAELLNGKQIPRQSMLLSHSPYIDENGLARISGRIDMANAASVDTKRPVILPPKHPYTKLLIKNYHEKAGHCL